MPVKLGNNNLTFSGISEIYVGSNKVYSSAIDYSTEYFFVENLTNSSNTLTIKETVPSGASRPTSLTIYRSTDKTTWTSMGNTSTAGITYSIPANSKVYLKATADRWAHTSSSSYRTISCSSNFAIGGNIMSLLKGDSFIGQTTLTGNKTFYNLFYNITTLKNIDKLVLPATTLISYCYQSMFNGCTGLTTLPSDLLPATTLTEYCYNQMFYGCTNLTNVPTLPATTLAGVCYNNMFRNCTSLTTLPSNLLPATNLATSCYGYMFYGCTNLTNVPNLPATTTAQSCYDNMFRDCTSLTTLPSNLLPATTLTGRWCYSYMFYGCTGLTNVPNLPATTLANQCYNYMFYGCTGLTSIPEDLLPATTLDTYCYQYMFYGCTGITTAPTLPATTLTDGSYRSMFQNCSKLNEITCYANDISATDCTTNWVSSVAASGTFYQKGNASWSTGVNGIPSGWTIVDDRPYDPSEDYFYIENPSTTDTRVISISSNSSQAPPSITVYTSTDKVNWYTAGTTSKYGSFNIQLGRGGRKYLKATATAWSGNGSTINIKCTQSFAIGGNIMSLIYGDDFIGQTALKSSSNGTFSSLFWRSTNLIDISNLVLPATTLINSCYSSMFEGCTGLTSIPSNLLPATTLTSSCYSSMFKGCTMITKAPILPATTLQTGSYFEMFRNCSSLIEITTYANNISATNCTYNWVNGVANNGTFYKLGSASWTTGGNGIPNSTWTVKTSLDS